MAITSTAWTALIAQAAISDAALFLAMSACVDDPGEDVADASATAAAATTLIGAIWELDPEQLPSLATGAVEWLASALRGCYADQTASIAVVQVVWAGVRDGLVNLAFDPAGFFNPDPVPDVGERSAGALTEALNIINTSSVGVANPT